MNIKITDHAYERAKERLSLSKSSFERFAEKSYSEGIKHSDTKGTLNKYITKIWSQYKTANNVRIYGEIVFLFYDNTLITVYQIPSNLKKYVKVFK